MEAGLPEPPVPADADLRDFAFMPLDVHRLRDSDLAATASAEEFRAAVLLWCAAWHQLPAGSLPSDDRVLASLVGFGRGEKAIEAWKQVKEVALDGFFLCNDGRLYHGVIAEKACESWQRKRESSERREAHRAKMGAWRAKKASPDGTPAPEKSVTVTAESREPSRDDTVTSLTGTGTVTGTGIKKEEHIPASGDAEASAGQPEKWRRHTYPEAFERFWAVYPRPANKLDAHRAWSRAVKHAASRADNPEGRPPAEIGAEAIQKAAEAFAQARKGDDPQYIPHAATWLNKGGWEAVPAKGSAKRPAGYVPMGVGG